MEYDSTMHYESMVTIHIFIFALYYHINGLLPRFTKNPVLILTHKVYHLWDQQSVQFIYFPLSFYPLFLSNISLSFLNQPCGASMYFVNIVHPDAQP